MKNKIFSLIAVSALIFAGCNSTNTESIIEDSISPTNQPSIEDVKNAMEEAESYTIVLDQGYSGNTEVKLNSEIDYQAPDRYSSISNAGNFTIETIIIGNTTYTKTSGITDWIVQENSSINPADLDKRFTDDYVLAGEKDGYWYYTGLFTFEDVTAPDTELESEVFVNKSTNYIEKIVATDDDGQTFETQFKNYDDPSIVIEAPIN